MMCVIVILLVGFINMFINDRIFHMPRAFLVYPLGCSWEQPGEVAREKFVFPFVHVI